ncbi:ASCH domain-containing protein [Madurella fahalii]|uniref:ASCH domain-containing protein n=1 Tax=Madurella fahalii TaxID=1157608 RepID=A0ABQ0GA91_9PEZI
MAPSRPALRQTTLNSCFRQGTHRVSKESSKLDKPNSNKAASHAKPKSSSDRVETDVLLAIKPVHLANIASQQKNHEYRKYCLRDGVTRLWFYETSEGGHGRSAITHIAVIPKSVRRTPGTVPTEPFGIGNDDFNKGLKQSKYGYPILELYELIEPVALSEMKDRWGLAAPMGWRYLGKDLWEDRWGRNERGRNEKVRKVF